MVKALGIFANPCDSCVSGSGIVGERKGAKKLHFVKIKVGVHVLR